MAGEQSVKTYGTPIQEVEIDGVYHKIEGSSSGGLTEISTQYIRITDLNTGIYKLTYDGDRYIYYNGTSSTDSVSVPSGFNLLSVTKTLNSWVWSFAPNGMFVNPIFSGVTYASSGSYQRNGVVCEVSSQTLYLYSMSAGQYRLTYNGAKTIYYGNNSTLPTTYGNFQGVIHLTINTYISGSTTYKIWHMLNGASGQYLLSGYTNESGSSSSYRAFNLSGSYLTTHLYRPIQVNGTQILANTASTALNLANDGNVKFAQVSGGKVKASITGLEVAKLYDFTVYNDTYSWGHLTSGNGYTQLFSLDTANGSSIGLAEKNGQLSMQIDGDYYGNEGANRLVYDYETPKTCLDSAGNVPASVSLSDTYFSTTAYIGTVDTSEFGGNSNWQYLINAPHRGGNGSDGPLYGFQLRTDLFTNQSLYWRTKNNGSWSSWSEIPRKTAALTYIATIDSSRYYLNPNNLSYGATYVMYSVFNAAQLEFGYYDEDEGDYIWYGTYGGAVYITFRQDWQIFVYVQSLNRYFALPITNDFAIKSNYGPIQICELKH